MDAIERAIDLEAGRCWRQVKPGMNIGITDLQLDMPYRFESQTFPAVCLSVVLEGYATNNKKTVEGGFCPNEVWVTSTGDKTQTSMTIHAENPVRVVELLLTPEWVEDNMGSMAKDPVFQRIARAMSEPLMVRRLELYARLRKIAWSVLNPPVEGPFVDIHQDSCALSMLCVLYEHFKSDQTQDKKGVISGKSLEKMLEIRRFIDADPVAAKSLSVIASRFGISQTTLKNGFKNAFGINARDYLLERRMIIGRNAILQHHLTIAEAAYEAGYDHPSNFTAAFKKYFGYPPSNMKI